MQIEEGIYIGMPESVYYDAEALSYSGMKKLMVSPLHYWHENINPEFVRKEESSFQRFGKAMHCRLLEPDRFRIDYGKKLSHSDYPGTLITVDDLKEFCVNNGLHASAKKKQELIERIQSSGLPATIWDDVVAQHELASEGKILLSDQEFQAIEGAAEIAFNDATASAALSGGVPEVSFFVRDEEMGVMLKARMDYVKPSATIDLKTFSNFRGKSTSKAVFDSIFYEGYYLQCVVYSYIRELARQKLASGDIDIHGNVSEEWRKAFTENDDIGFGFIFLESESPHDMRLMRMRREEAAGAQPNVYWSVAEMRMAEMMQLYADCKKRFGDSPWRTPQSWSFVSDMDLPQLVFA